MRRLPVWTCLTASLAVACGGGQDPSTFTVAPRAFRATATTIVLTPLQVPDDLAVPESLAAMLDSLVHRTVQEGGFTVVPAAAYADIWDAAAREAGGFYDPYTGERIEHRFDQARGRLVTELTERFGAEALLYPELWVVDAPYAGGVARWDGASQGLVGWGTRLLHAIASLGDDDESLGEGVVAALSFVVFLEDLAGAEIYRHVHGIEVLEKLEGGRPVPVDTTALFRDDDRYRDAVRRALEALVERRP